MLVKGADLVYLKYFLNGAIAGGITIVIVKTLNSPGASFDGMFGLTEACQWTSFLVSLYISMFSDKTASWQRKGLLLERDLLWLRQRELVLQYLP